MWFEPKRGLDWRQDDRISFLLICNKVSGDQRIFISAPLMIQQEQKYPASDTPLSLPAKSRAAWDRREMPPHTALCNMTSGFKRLRVGNCRWPELIATNTVITGLKRANSYIVHFFDFVHFKNDPQEQN